VWELILFSEYSAIAFININLPKFITVMQCVFLEVRTELLHKYDCIYVT